MAIKIEEPATVRTSLSPEIDDGDARLSTLDDMGIPNTWPEDESFSASRGVLEYLPALPAPAQVEEMPVLEPETQIVAPYSSPAHSHLFSSDPETESDVKDSKAVPGVCGLRNLGNTCFMSAGLQCLLNNRTFAQYFLENFEEDDSSKDTLTSSFARLVNKVWSGNFGVLRPSDFKDILGQCHPQFKDYRQHDCQELLALLLDTLHEQLNTACSKSSRSESSLGQSIASVDDKTVEMDPEENRSDVFEECELRTQPDLVDSEVNDQSISGLASDSHSQQLISDNSSHSTSPRSTDSLSSWDTNTFRLRPIPEDVKPFSDLTSDINDVKGNQCLEGESSTMVENNATEMDCSRMQVDEEECNILPIDNLSRGKVSLRIKPTLVSSDSNRDRKLEKNELASKFNSSRRIPTIEDFVKDTKILNTNMLVDEEKNNQLKFDSSKFPKPELVRPQETVDNLGEVMELDGKTCRLKRIKKTNILKDCKDNNLSAAEVEDCISTSKKMKMEQVEETPKSNLTSETLTKRESCCSAEEERTSTACVKQKQEGLSLVEDEIEAEKQWDRYLAKNQSIVVDTFQGQFKSMVICSECGHVSVTYEPFMYLPVPLPHALERQIVITYVPYGVQNPTRYLVSVCKQEKVSKIGESLIAMIDENPPQEVALAEVVDNHISRVLDDDVLVCYVNDTNRTVFAFEVCRSSSLNSRSDSPLQLPPFSTDLASLSSDKSFQTSEEIAGDRPMYGPHLPEQADECPQPLQPLLHSCAICLEETVESDVYIHPSCQCILCNNCVQVSSKHYGKGTLLCPVCSVPVEVEDFIPISQIDSHNYKARIISIPLMFRYGVYDSLGNPEEKLVCYPFLLRLPCRISAPVLYEMVDKCVPHLYTYTLLYVDTQGKTCSRCAYSSKCLGCEVSRIGDVTFQPGDSLALKYTEVIPLEQLENATNLADHKSMALKRNDETLTLYDCLGAFSESETLDEHNPWFCPMCQQNQRARKSLSVWRSPDTLMVYLKRFVFHEFSSTKVDDRVEFPLEGLNLSQFVSGPINESISYNLQAYVCHFGSVNSGHYTAYARHASSGEWYYFNDESASKQEPGEEDHSNAYILFYQKPGTKCDPSLPKKNTLFEKPVISPDEGSSSSVGLRPDTFNSILKQLEENAEAEKTTSEQKTSDRG